MKRALKETTLFRSRFSITQEDLAAYLGISYSALAMYERGERPLATKVLLKFAELYAAYETAEKSAGIAKPLPALQEKLDKQRDDAVEKMQELITGHAQRIGMLQHKLKKITGKHEGAAERLHLFEGMIAALPKTEAAKYKAQELEEIYTKVCTAILENNKQKLKMQLAIALLQAEMKVYEAEVGRLKEEGEV